MGDFKEPPNTLSVGESDLALKNKQERGSFSDRRKVRLSVFRFKPYKTKYPKLHHIQALSLVQSEFFMELKLSYSDLVAFYSHLALTSIYTYK